MSVFSFLQNEIGAAGSAINNGVQAVSNTYHAAVNNVGSYLSGEAKAAGTGLSNVGSTIAQNYNRFSQGNTGPQIAAQNYLNNQTNYIKQNGAQNALNTLKYGGNVVASHLPVNAGYAPGVPNPLAFALSTGETNQNMVNTIKNQQATLAGNDANARMSLLKDNAKSAVMGLAFASPKAGTVDQLNALHLGSVKNTIGLNVPERPTTIIHSPQQATPYRITQGTESPSITLPNHQVEAYIRDGKVPTVNDYTTIKPGQEGNTRIQFDQNGKITALNPDNPAFEKSLMMKAGTPNAQYADLRASTNPELTPQQIDTALQSPNTQLRTIDRTKLTGKALDTPTRDLINPEEKPLVPTESTQTSMDNFANQSALKDQQLPLKSIAKEAVQQKNSLAQQIRSYGSVVNNVVSKLSPTDSSNLAHALEHPTEAPNFIHNAEDPVAFSKSLTTTQEQLKNVLSARNGSAADTLGTVPNYFPHDFTTEHPEAAARALENQGYSAADAQNYIAKSSKERVFPDIRTAHSLLDENGNQIFQQNPDSAAVLKKYFSSQALESGNSAMTNTLSTLAPDHINTGGQLLRGPDGKPMQSLNAPGLGGTAVSQDLHQHLQGLEPSAFADNKTIKTLDKAGGALKEVKLGLGGFHVLTTGLNDLAPEIMQGRFTTLPKAFASMVSGDYRAASLERNIANGNVDWLSKAGATIGRGPDGIGETLAAKVGKLNPIERFTNGVFNGFINEIKYSIGEYYKGKGIDPTSAEGRSVGSQINNLFGGIDKQVLNRNQTIQQGLRLASISPDFTEGKIRSAGAAANLTNWDAGHTLARTSVVGKVILTAVLSELANRLTTGKWDSNLVTFLKQRVLDPQFSLPSQFNRPGSNTPTVAHLPSNIVTDGYKLATDPKAFLTGRAGSAVSLATEALNNKDYYGRQIYNPNDSIIQKGLKLGQTQLPIPVTNVLNTIQGKESAPAAALNIAGLRVTSDPTAPSVIGMTAQGNYAKTLDAKSAADYAALHPPTTDAAGNPIGSKDILNSALRSTIYLNHPEFLAFDTQNARTAGGQQDPFYTQLTPDQQKLVLAAAVKIPGQTNNYTKQLYATNWYQPFQDARTAFYNSLPASSTPPAVNVDQTGNTTQQSQAKAYNAQALTQLGLPSAPSSTFSGSSGGITGVSAPKGIAMAKTGVRVSGGGGKRKSLGGKIIVGHIGKQGSLKPKAPKLLKPLTVKNVGGKSVSLKAPRAPKSRGVSFSNPQSSRSLRRRV